MNKQIALLLLGGFLSVACYGCHSEDPPKPPPTVSSGASATSEASQAKKAPALQAPGPTANPAYTSPIGSKGQ